MGNALNQSSLAQLLVGVASATIIILGSVVFLNNKKSSTHRAFFLFSLISAMWGISNYFNYQLSLPLLALWAVRLHIFIAVWYAFILFHLFYIFPRSTLRFPKVYKYGLVPLVALTSIFNLTPLVFSGLTKDPVIGQAPIVERGAALPLFLLVTIGLVLSSIVILIYKTIKAGTTEKRQYKFVLIGVIITFPLMIFFNLILPAVFLNVTFIPLGAVFTLPFLLFTSYAILKHHLFNIKVIATELLTFTLWLLLLIKVVVSTSLSDAIVGSVILIGTFVLGMFLIRSVLKEVQTREKMEKMAKALEIANRELRRLDEAKSDFISIASHQLRSPLSAIKGYVSLILEGTFGRVNKKLLEPLRRVYISNERLVNLVSDLLDLSRMERGKMEYEFKVISFSKTVEGVVEEFQPVAEKKGLKFTYHKETGMDTIWGDEGKLRQVIINLIDNAIKYTQKGGIKVLVEPEGGFVKLDVTDTGPGLTKEEIYVLFQKFARGTRGSKHAEGLGLGLYVAKLIVEAHNGKLTVESNGRGKGSTFSLIIPIYDQTKANFSKFASEI